VTETADMSACPAEEYRFSNPPSPAGTVFERMDGHQDRNRPFLHAEEAKGYWVFTDHDVIVDGLQRPDLWSSAVVLPTQPDPPYRWVPIMLDSPEHTRWRQLLSGYFSPRRVKESQSSRTSGC
jgi:cytochrome P450